MTDLFFNPLAGSNDAPPQRPGPTADEIPQLRNELAEAVGNLELVIRRLRRGSFRAMALNALTDCERWASKELTG